MKLSKFFRLFFPFAMLGIPWIYLAYIWNELPQTVATHFGINGAADRFGDKSEVVFIMLIIAAAGLATYFILQNLYKIDPKKKYTETTSAVMKKISAVVIMLLSFLLFFILNSMLHAKITGMPVLFCGLSLFLAYTGNLMHSIKPNYFAGIRIPWTLESEDNWRKTHQLASKVWFAGGIFLAILSLLLNTKILMATFLSIVVIMLAIPIIYSYVLYKRSLQN